MHNISLFQKVNRRMLSNQQSIRVVLAGNPNCGKTAIFNGLTGSKQRVGNWSGVTVDKKIGRCQQQGYQIDVVDLPGTYGLDGEATHGALDEAIARDYLLSNQADIIVNVIDASHLERNLYLTTQLLGMGIPLVVALNMTDVAAKEGIHIDIEQLSQRLGCVVVAMVAQKNQGVDELKNAMVAASKPNYQQSPFVLCLADTYKESIDYLAEAYESAINSKPSHWLLLQLLQGLPIQHKIPQSLQKLIQQQRDKLLSDIPFDIIVADQRYTVARDIATAVSCDQVSAKKSSAHKKNQGITAAIDRWVLNKWLGIPVFLFVMYGMFFFAINIGGAFQDFFDIGSDALFVQGMAHMLQVWHAPGFVIAVVAHGLGRGINTVVTFTPVIAGMFLFLSFLEDSGYMARAAFVMDRLMQRLGLPGKAFVPMLIGFGCNVPAVMATRTLETPRERILTVMMLPFVSCGARLAIFSINSVTIRYVHIAFLIFEPTI